LAIILLVAAVACLRFEVFASASAPPSPNWRGDGLLFTDTIPLENVPVVVSSVTAVEGMTVTLANVGTTTLTYSSAGPSNIQLFQEYEEMGKWTPEKWDWCGTGKSDFDLAAGEQVDLAVDFWDARRERMLACFTEKDTNRSGLVVLASEGRRVTPDGERALQFFSAALAAVCIWLAVRIVNRRERWAMRTAAVLIVVFVGYPLSLGPLVWLHRGLGRPTWMNTVCDSVYEPLHWSFRHAPESVNKVMDSYLAWWDKNP
jgi:hypothetical protein